MIRFLFKALLLLLLAAVVYGVYLLYGEKSPEEQAQVREQLRAAADSAARTTVEALKKTGGKVKELVDDREREGQD